MSDAGKVSLLGTCVEAPTPEMMTKLGFDNEADWSKPPPSTHCADNKAKLSNMLMVSVHALWNAYTVDTETSSGEAPLSTSLQLVTNAVVSATLGLTTVHGPAINISMANEAIEMIKDTPLPKTCDDLYPGANISSLMTASTPKPVNIACSEYVPGSEISVDVNKLYTHCVLQFSFGRSGIADGALSIPKVGETPGPLWSPWPLTSGDNGTLPWDSKARIIVGQRIGWSLWAYSPLLFGSAYFAFDAATMILAELTRSQRITDSSATYKVFSNAFRAVQSMARVATFNRRFRFTVGILIVITSSIFVSVGLWTTFGIDGYRFPRPVCNGKNEDRFMGGIWGSPDSIGGWHTSYNPGAYEVFAISSQIFALFVSVFVSLFESIEETFLTGEQSKENQLQVDENEYGRIRPLRLFAPRLTFIATIGTLFLAGGNAFSGSSFGQAWAAAVAGERYAIWNTIIVGKRVFDIGLTSLYSMMTAGFAIGALVSRWLIIGKTCTSALIMGVFFSALGGAYLPWIIRMGVSFFTEFNDVDTNGKIECSMFKDVPGYGFEHNSCTWSYWLLLIGSLTLVSASAIQFIIAWIDWGQGARTMKWNKADPKVAEVYQSAASANGNESLEVRRMLLTQSPPPPKESLPFKQPKLALFRLPIKLKLNS
tara:strand:+ start:234 stop:2195 length:1962 start_codon:yes stop_codon:yes gene_type:complete